MGEPSDELLSCAVGGDLGALNTLLRAYGGRVRNALQRRIEKQWRSAIDPDDVMQVTYLEAFLRIEQLRSRGVGSFLAWLEQIAENNLRDAIKGLRRGKRPPPEKRIEPSDEEGSCVALLEQLGVTSTTPSRQAGRREICAMMSAALTRLPTDYERVIRLYDLEGRGVDEVAAALNRSEGAVYMLRARAHDRLREVLGSASNFFSDGA